MILYLLTISCQQKKEFILPMDLHIVINHLQKSGVIILKGRYENHGLYNQLHFHAIVNYSGYYKSLTQYGDKEHDKTYRIDFKRIRPGTVFAVDNYLNKQNQDQVLTTNYWKIPNLYYNQDTCNFELVATQPNKTKRMRNPIPIGDSSIAEFNERSKTNKLVTPSPL